MTHTRLTALDPLLGPATAGHTDPRRAALAALCRGLDATPAVPPRTTRSWLRVRRPDTRDVIESAPAWHRLVAAARARVSGTGGASSPEARAEATLQVARRLLTHLMSPCPDGMNGRRSTAARGALAVIGVTALRQVHEKGWDSVLVTAPWLGVQMGVARLAASKALSWAIEAGWLRVVKKQRGGGTVVRLARVPAESQARAWSLYDLIEETADVQSQGDTTDPDASLAVQLIFTADHPVWGYSEKDADRPTVPAVSRVTWLVALADALNVDPVDRFGLGHGAVVSHRRHVDRLGLDGPGRVVDRLDEWGERGAMDRYRAAEEARRAAAEERRAAVLTEREKRANARTVLNPVLAKRAGRIPEPEEGEEALWAWAEKVAEALRTVHLGEPAVIVDELTRRLVRALHAKEAAQEVAQWIVQAAEEAPDQWVEEAVGVPEPAVQVEPKQPELAPAPPTRRQRMSVPVPATFIVGQHDQSIIAAVEARTGTTGWQVKAYDAKERLLTLVREELVEPEGSAA